jgi:hypothetical protein
MADGRQKSPGRRLVKEMASTATFEANKPLLAVVKTLLNAL